MGEIAATAADATVAPISARRAIVTAIIGNGLEWYNFTLYGFFAGIIGQKFFPTGDQLSSLLLSLGTFGVGFFIRPVGGVLLGIYSDRVGRKPALSLTILLMCLGTAIIAAAPGYRSIGIAAPLLMVLARLLQGFSTGGEMGNATAFMKEYAPAGRRATWLAWVYASSGLFIALGTGVASLTAAVLGHAALESEGWRVPFLLGLVIGPVGLVLRNSIAEPARERRSTDRVGQPFREVLAHHPGATLASGALIVLSTTCTYVIHVYTPIYAVRTLGLSAAAGFGATLVGNLLNGLLTPVGGRIADAVGTRVMLRGAALLFFVLAVPMFAYVVAAPGLLSLMVYQVTFAVIAAGYHGAVLAGIDELFPGHTLATGLSLADNVAVAIFGGSAAFTITALIAATGSKMIPGYYLMAAALIGLAGTLARRRTWA